MHSLFRSFVSTVEFVYFYPVDNIAQDDVNRWSPVRAMYSSVRGNCARLEHAMFYSENSKIIYNWQNLTILALCDQYTTEVEGITLFSNCLGDMSLQKYGRIAGFACGNGVDTY